MPPRRPTAFKPGLAHGFVLLVVLLGGILAAVESVPRELDAGARAAERSQAEEAEEYAVKAAFLYNFAKFTAWPKSSFKDKDSPFVVASLGAKGFAPGIEKAFEGKKIRKRSVVVRRFTSLEDLGDCHILFVSKAMAKHLADIRKKTKGKHVLLVGESKDFARKGGVVNFYLEDDRVRFEINVDEADRCKLKISSKLLRLAKIIEDEKKGEEGRGR